MTENTTKTKGQTQSGCENKTEINFFWGLSCDRNMSGTSAIHRLDRHHGNHPVHISGSSIYGCGWSLAISQSTLGGVPCPAHKPVLCSEGTRAKWTMNGSDGWGLDFQHRQSDPNKTNQCLSGVIRLHRTILGVSPGFYPHYTYNVICTCTPTCLQSGGIISISLQLIFYFVWEIK